jgi:hypothetical protein
MTGGWVKVRFRYVPELETRILGVRAPRASGAVTLQNGRCAAPTRP